MSAAILTEAQADGRACLICGCEDAPMEPAVEPQWSPTGVMLFRCADTQACQANMRRSRTRVGRARPPAWS